MERPSCYGCGGFARNIVHGDVLCDACRALAPEPDNCAICGVATVVTDGDIMGPVRTHLGGVFVGHESRGPFIYACVKELCWDCGKAPGWTYSEAGY